METGKLEVGRRVRKLLQAFFQLYHLHSLINISLVVYQSSSGIDNENKCEVKLMTVAQLPKHHSKIT